MKTLDNMQDVIDSRDIIARIEELTEEREDLTSTIENLEEQISDLDTDNAEDCKQLDELTEELEKARAHLNEWDTDNAEELKALTDLQDEAEYSPDWEYGEALIRRSYFQDYAQELAEDCGMLKDCDSWPNRCIDWEQAARELEQDYMSVDFGGVEYLIRG